MIHIACCSLGEVPYCFSRSSVKFQGHTALNIVELDPDWAFADCNSSLNSPMAKKWCTKLEVALKRCPIVFSCDQAAIWLVQSVRLSVRPSVRPSVCLSVCHTFFTMFPSSFHHEIFRSYYHGQKWCPCKRSRSEVKGQGHRGQHPTQPFPDSNSSLNSHMAMKSCTQLEAA